MEGTTKSVLEAIYLQLFDATVLLISYDDWNSHPELELRNETHYDNITNSVQSQVEVSCGTDCRRLHIYSYRILTYCTAHIYIASCTKH